MYLGTDNWRNFDQETKKLFITGTGTAGDSRRSISRGEGLELAPRAFNWISQ